MSDPIPKISSKGKQIDLLLTQAARLEALVEKQTQEIRLLRAEVRAVVTHTSTTARILKRANLSGDAIDTQRLI